MPKNMVQHKEIDIENFIWKTITGDGFEDLRKRGFHIGGRIYRQFKLPGCGIIDLISFKRRVFQNQKVIIIDIYELKRGVATAAHLLQLNRYQSFFYDNYRKVVEYFDVERIMPIECFLVAQDFDKDVIQSNGSAGAVTNFLKYDFCFSSGIKFEEVESTYEIDEDIFTGFKAEGVLTDEIEIGSYSFRGVQEETEDFNI